MVFSFGSTIQSLINFVLFFFSLVQIVVFALLFKHNKHSSK
uniref:Uncharacterized protein n=1 Tax=Rhizophora mucronata TaxID=61149 RepID=A0A2P2P374_RHIMU